jgi:hypothetical protein
MKLIDIEKYLKISKALTLFVGSDIIRLFRFDKNESGYSQAHFWGILRLNDEKSFYRKRIFLTKRIEPVFSKRIYSFYDITVFQAHFGRFEILKFFSILQIESGSFMCKADNSLFPLYLVQHKGGIFSGY